MVEFEKKIWAELSSAETNNLYNQYNVCLLQQIHLITHCGGHIWKFIFVLSK